MEQGSFFDSRVFLSRKQERKLVCELLTEEIACEEFLESDNILVSDHIRLISSLLERISAEWPDEIPAPYKR